MFRFSAVSTARSAIISGATTTAGGGSKAAFSSSLLLRQVVDIDAESQRVSTMKQRKVGRPTGSQAAPGAFKKPPNWRKHKIENIPAAVELEMSTREAIRGVMSEHFDERSKKAQELLDAEEATAIPTLETDPVGYFRIERQREKSDNAQKWLLLERTGATVHEIEAFKEDAVLESQTARFETMKSLHQNININRQIAAGRAGAAGGVGVNFSPEDAILGADSNDPLLKHRNGQLEHQQQVEAQKYFATKDDPMGRKAAMIRRKMGILGTGTTLNVDDVMAAQDEILQEQQQSRQMQVMESQQQQKHPKPIRMTDDDEDDKIEEPVAALSAPRPTAPLTDDFDEDETWEDTPTASGGYFTSSAFHASQNGGSRTQSQSLLVETGSIRTEAPTRRQIPGVSPIVGTGFFTAFNSAAAPGAATAASGLVDEDEMDDGSDISGGEGVGAGGEQMMSEDYTFDPELEESF